eukprot:UN24591
MKENDDDEDDEQQDNVQMSNSNSNKRRKYRSPISARSVQNSSRDIDTVFAIWEEDQRHSDYKNWNADEIVTWIVSRSDSFLFMNKHYITNYMMPVSQVHFWTLVPHGIYINLALII